MDNTTLLIIIIVLLVLGGGWYGRGRWFETRLIASCLGASQTLPGWFRPCFPALTK